MFLQSMKGAIRRLEASGGKPAAQQKHERCRQEHPQLNEWVHVFHTSPDGSSSRVYFKTAVAPSDS